jgi:CRP/FNR family transcriptional regulator, cyclic AMP receptor protein
MIREETPKGNRMACVLVIDDETTVGVVLRLALSVKGHRTISAEDGRTGIEMARVEHPDAIVLDMMMPGGLSGYDVLGELRKETELDAIPVLVLTAITRSMELQRCLSEGADAVMTKPFDPLDVANAIDRLLFAQRGTRVESGRPEVKRFRPQ